MPINIEEVKRCINDNLKDIKLIDDVADRLSISVETLRKEFLQKEKKSLHDYIEETRVERAKHMLVTTDSRCFEICFEVGYRREDTGAKAFKQLTGLRMEDFRARYRNGKGEGVIPELPTTFTNQNRQPKLPTRKANH